MKIIVSNDDGRDDESTPVDEDFAPEEKGPAEGLGPELLSREGKWYLRENATGKEVEITAKREDESSETPFSIDTIKNFLQARPLLTAAAVLVVGAAFALILRTALIGPHTQTIAWTFEKYSSAVRRALVEFDAGELERAEHFLTDASSNYRENDLADLLLDAVDVWKDPKRREDRRETEKVLDAVSKYAGRDFADVADWAGRQRYSIRRDADMEAKVSEAQDLIAAGRLNEALDILAQVPSNSKWHARAREIANDLSTILSEGFLDMAREAMRNEEWETALDYFRKAVEAGVGEDLIQTSMDRCRRNQRDKETLTRAQQHFEESRFDPALSTLALIPENSRYFEEARALRSDVSIGRVLENTGNLYDRGDKRSALAALEGRKEPAFAALREKILQVAEAYDNAKKMFDANRIEDAMVLWEEIIRLEPNEQNFYHFRSLDQMAEWEDNPEKIAGAYLEEALECEAVGDYPAMREWLVKASRIDPGNETCEKKLEDLKNEAIRLFLKATNIKGEDPRQALDQLKTVIKMLPVDSPYRKRAEHEIEKLEGLP